MMLVEPTADRLDRVEARLIRHVDFGWGILGCLYREGSFLLQQRDVRSGRWAITTLGLHYNGKILVLKNMKIDSVTTASDFRRMPDDLTIEQGLKVLLNQDRMVTAPQVRQRLGTEFEFLLISWSGRTAERRARP